MDIEDIVSKQTVMWLLPKNPDFLPNYLEQGHVESYVQVQNIYQGQM